MARRSLDSFGDLQRAVMEIVWEAGAATVHEVRDALARREPLAYTTVLSVMQKLERLGWLKHRREGRAYVYAPARTRDEAGANSLRAFVGRVFRGDPLLLFETLLTDENLTAEELGELRRRIDARAKELGGKGVAQ